MNTARWLLFGLIISSGTTSASSKDLLICEKELVKSIPKVDLSLNMPVLATYANTDSTCKSNPFDPYEMPARLIGGSDANQCLLTKDKRPIIKIPDSELAKYGLAPKKGYMTVANFKHEGKFHVAQIPIDYADSAILQSSKMIKVGPLTAGHGQIRIKFSRPITMVEQDLSSQNKEIKKSYQVISSLDAVGAVAGYEPVTRGLNGSYMGILNVSSVEEKAKVMKDYQSQIVQYKLKLDKEDLKKYFQAFVKQSELRGTSHAYNTLHDNCGQVHLDVLDGAIDYKKYGGLKPASLSTVYGYINPDQIVKSFERRGLSSESERIEDFHNDPLVIEEIGSYKVKFLTKEKK